MEPLGRKSLPHDLPPWIDPAASDFFVTICCQRRGRNQLCLPGIGEDLLASARFYYEQHRWYPAPFLLMPDHLHMLVSFGRNQDTTRVIRDWKHYTARKHGIEWQRDFFEHRLRATESGVEKYDYILSNPVRAGLVKRAVDWQWVWSAEDRSGCKATDEELRPAGTAIPTLLETAGTAVASKLAFQPVPPTQADELLAAVRRYYAEDGLRFDEALVRPALARLLAEPALGRAFFLRDEQGARAGYTVITFGFDHEAGGPLATVTDLFIEPAHRRRGYARATLQFLADTCRALGVRGLELQVERHNPAGQALYRGFGFQEHDRIPMFLPLG